MTFRRMTAFGWTPWHLLGAALMGALGVWVTLDAWRDILFIATMDEEASHIFLVPFVAAWLIAEIERSAAIICPRGRHARIPPAARTRSRVDDAIGDLLLPFAFAARRILPRGAHSSHSNVNVTITTSPCALLPRARLGTASTAPLDRLARQTLVSQA